MSEKITCPFCEKSFDLEQIETGDIWRERADLASRLNSAWKLANEYIDAFRAKPGARMSLKKGTRHLRGLAALWKKCEFEYQGKRYRTSRESILNAMTTVCELEKTGFVNHNYLKKVLLPTASRVSAEGMTAKEEVRREEVRRKGRPLEAEDADKEKDLEKISYREHLEKIKKQSHAENAEDTEV